MPEILVKKYHHSADDGAVCVDKSAEEISRILGKPKVSCALVVQVGCVVPFIYEGAVHGMLHGCPSWLPHMVWCMGRVHGMLHGTTHGMRDSAVRGILHGEYGLLHRAVSWCSAFAP